MTRVAATSAAAATIAFGLVLGVATPSSATTPTRAGTAEPDRVASIDRPDFNGDGFADLATGAPLEDIDPSWNAGSVTVLYGGPSGLTAAQSQRWTKAKLGLGGATGSDVFGHAVSFADITGDGYDDLVIGAPGDTVDGIRAGAMYVVPGSASGLTATGAQVWSQGTADILGDPQDGDGFGAAVLARDFDNDGFGDVAVSAPSAGPANIGEVNVLYGTASGLASARNQVWHEIGDPPESSEEFGSSLTVGNYDHDGFRDLVIGVRLERTDPASPAGAFMVLYGTASGLTADRAQLWTRDSPGIKGTTNGWTFVGAAAATGDFDGDGFDDLAVGAPGGRGSVTVLYGSASGLAAARNQLWSQSDLGLDAGGRQGDSFGHDVAAGDLNGDGRYDLIVGISGEDVRQGDVRLVGVGAVVVLYGTAHGLRAADFAYLENVDFSDPSTRLDNYGESVAAADYNGDGRSDLTIAIPGSDAARKDGGAVEIRAGQADGLGAPDVWTLDTPGVPGSAKKFARLGHLTDR